MRAKRCLLALLAALVLATGLTTSQASAYQSLGATNLDNPLANKQWFVDWARFGMSQEQFLRYLTNNHLERIDQMVYGDRLDVTAYHGRNRRNLQMQARAEVGKDPNAWLARVPEANREKARLMLKLARNPQTMRVGRWTHNPGYRVRLGLQQMEETNPGALAFLYIYRLQKSTSTGACGNHSAGGPRDWAAYKRFVAAVARGIANHNVAVFLEPDGLGMTACLTGRKKRARYKLFRYAIKKLSHNPNTVIYLDAGHSGWLKARRKVKMLRKAGVMNPRVRGFFLNSTGYNRTTKEKRHGIQMARLLRGKHFVISTAVNGNGPYKVKRRRFEREQRCNPPGRALGAEPSVQTGTPWADAFVWIGDPGRSGGCRHRGQPKPPPPSHWWEWYALQLAKNAHWQ